MTASLDTQKRRSSTPRNHVHWYACCSLDQLIKRSLTMYTPQRSAVGHQTIRPDDRALCERVRAEFAEMPGLSLTLPQASRLFDLDPVHCESVLWTLVRSGMLRSDGHVFLGAGART